jgi:hypothetical protein
VDKIAEATEEKQHYGGSVHYRKMMEEIEKQGSIELHDDISLAFAGSRQLVQLGFMSTIDWSVSNHHW